MDEPQRPEVRVVGETTAVTAPAPQPPRPDRARPRLRPLLALLAAASVGYGLSELHATQRDAGPQRSASGLSLETEPGSAVTVATAADGAVQVRVPVLVRNTGTSAVDLRGATLDGLGVRGTSQGQRALGQGATARLLVAQDLRCPRTRRALQDAPEPGPLALTVAATGTAEPHVVRLPLPDGVLDDVHDVLGSACSDVPLSGALQLHVESAAQTPEQTTGQTPAQVRLQVRLDNTSDRPVDVTAVSVPAGFRLQLRAASGRLLHPPLRIAPEELGRRAVFRPATPPPSSSGSSGSRYEVRISVRSGGCDQARRSSRRSPVVVPVTVVRDGEQQVLSQVDDAGLLRQLTARTCP